MLNFIRDGVFVGKMFAMLTLVTVIRAYIDSDDIISIRFDFFKSALTEQVDQDPYFSDLFKTFKVQRISLDGDKLKQLECTNFIDMSHTVEYRQNELFKDRRPD